MAPRRPNAFEVSFPDEFVPHEATSLQPEALGSNPFTKGSSLKRQGGSLRDVRVRYTSWLIYGESLILFEPFRRRSGIGCLQASLSLYRIYIVNHDVGNIEVSIYEDRRGELESADLAIIGEDPFTDGDEGDPDAKPVRVLSDFAIYDPKHGSEMVPLSSIEEDDGVDRQFEAEGFVSPYYQNDEDEGQEDDDENKDSNACEPKLVKLGAILRYTFDYTETDG